MIRWLLAAGMLAASVLLLGCASEEQGVQPSSIPTSGAERTGSSVDCGSGETVSTDDLAEIVLHSGDVTADLRPFPTSAVVLDDLGDDDFKDTVEPSRYVGGLAAVFGSGEVLQGGRGHLLTSMVMVFTDVDAAAALLNHPSVGEPSVDRPVDTPTFGDATDSRYVEVSMDDSKLAGHIISFRVGHLVAYIANLAADEDAPLDETERLARLVCERIRQRPTGTHPGIAGTGARTP